jgi:hypothetical protein
MNNVAHQNPDAETALAQESRVRQLEGVLLGMPQVDLSTTTLLHGGMCTRTIFIPAGVALTGAKTNKANVCILQGDITVTTDAGPRRLTGFHVIAADAGLKRAGYAHADTYWTTVWPTEADSQEAAEDEMTAESAQLQTRHAQIAADAPLPAVKGE